MIVQQRFRFAGFTLIELLFVIAIIAILAALTAALSPGLLKGHRMRSAGMELMASLVMARSEAVRLRADVTVTPVAASDWAQGWAVTVGGTTTLRSQPILEGIKVTGGPANIVFQGTGRLAPGAANVAFQVDLLEAESAYQRCIRMDLSGAPRSSSGACS